ncbi:unnamed protein product [Phytomonas sp. Hart1]|nr:unnamed protein product [Phytomonas sp. Hart1]|eukprot:CCW70947.1 unnamed protein product [Phytomonas sp. isolate Hart1]
MSYRELRLFTESMRLLGYPNLISMESFRTPNVELVADCLFWLLKRYEPSSEVIYTIEREYDRVQFFKQVCEAVLARARLKLNIKKLYQADGHAVQEMLKLTQILKDAMRSTGEEEPDFAAIQQMAAQKSVLELRTIQGLCSGLTTDAGSLYDYIGTEMKARMERQRVLSRATEVDEFERRLKELLTKVSQKVEELQQTIANLNADENNLEQKIESKKTQLERTQKRYKSLMTVRPAFIEEYDRYEGELQGQFVKYLEQYRNLEYLEYQLAKFNAKEDALLKEQQTVLSVMRERLRKEELEALHGGKAGKGFIPHINNGSNSANEDFDSDMNGRICVRNAAEEGSSISDTDEDDLTDTKESSGGVGGGRFRMQNATGLNQTSQSSELSKRRQGPSFDESESDTDDLNGGVTPSGVNLMHREHPSGGRPPAARTENGLRKRIGGGEEEDTSSILSSDDDSDDMSTSSNDDDNSDDEDSDENSSSEESDI